jgi:hypothetical protein
MSFFRKQKPAPVAQESPKLDIDYEFGSENWDGTEKSSAARLSFERMKYKDTDKQKQQSIRERPWYVDIPYFLKGVVVEGDTFRVSDVEPQIKGRFFGKTPEDAKRTFEVYFKSIKANEEKKLQEKLKELEAKKIVQASQAAQAVLEKGTNPPAEITTALAKDDTNPSAPGTPVVSPTPSENPTPLNSNSDSPFSGLEVNAGPGPAVRTSKLSAENIAARKAASKTRRTEARKPKQWTNKNTLKLRSQQAMGVSAEKALRAPTDIVNPMALQRNKLRAAQASTKGRVPTQTRKINTKRLQASRSYASPATKFGRRQTILAKDANQTIDSQIATMFNNQATTI